MTDYDLHIHTTASDGLLTPEDIFKVALDKNLNGISVTDHDTVNALAECEGIASQLGIDFIPGIEISSDYIDYDIHILGYFIDYTDKQLLSFLDWLQQTRDNRNRKIIELLRSLGYDVYYEEILRNISDHNKSIGRPHIARLLIEKGYFKSINEVFNQLLGTGKPAYVNRYKISIEDAASIILKSKGSPIIAHPLINSKFNVNNDFEDFIKLCIGFGIKGIEVFHTLHNEEQEQYLFELAKKYKLVVTGGSDCHGELIEGHYLLGTKGIASSEILELKRLKR